jgi:hypothetical protein
MWLIRAANSRFRAEIARELVATLVRHREQTRLIRKEVVSGVLVWVASLVEHLQIAWVDCLGFVGIGADQIPVADVVRPCGGGRERDVALAGERRCLGRRPWDSRPGPSRGSGSWQAARQSWPLAYGFPRLGLVRH